MKYSTCKIDDCGLMVRARGMCSRHYSEWRRGTPPEDRDRYPRRRAPRVPQEVDRRGWVTVPPVGTVFTITLTTGRPVHLNQRDLDRLERSFHVADDGCWRWKGSKDKDGYGKLKVTSAGQKTTFLVAHRVAWAVRNERQVPKGMTLDHLCRSRSCVNPDHLDPCEIWENTQRGKSAATINQAKTHCKRGHELSGDNVHESPGRRGRPHRHCKTCRKELQAKRNELESVIAGQVKSARRTQGESEC